MSKSLIQNYVQYSLYLFFFVKKKCFLLADSYTRHPNSYLPAHEYNIPTEADDLHSPEAESDDVEPYGFPSNRNRRKNCDDDIASVITTLGKIFKLIPK